MIEMEVRFMGIFGALSGGITEILLYLLTMAFMLLAILPVHECAHALMAKILGDDTAQRAGRLTLNPMAHLNPMGALCMLLIGFGWAEPVPVNPVRFNNQKRRQGYMALVAFAGPLSNLIMSLLWLIVYRIIRCFDMSYSFYTNMSYVMSLLIVVNLGLAVFNLLPIGPLDGAKIFNWIIPDRAMYKIQNSLSKIMSGIHPAFYLILFFVVVRLLSTPLNHVENWLLDRMIDGVDAVFGLFGLGYGNVTY